MKPWKETGAPPCRSLSCSSISLTHGRMFLPCCASSRYIHASLERPQLDRSHPRPTTTTTTPLRYIHTYHTSWPHTTQPPKRPPGRPRDRLPAAVFVIPSSPRRHWPAGLCCTFSTHCRDVRMSHHRCPPEQVGILCAGMCVCMSVKYAVTPGRVPRPPNYYPFCWTLSKLPGMGLICLPSSSATP